MVERLIIFRTVYGTWKLEAEPHKTHGNVQLFEDRNRVRVEGVHDFLISNRALLDAAIALKVSK